MLLLLLLLLFWKHIFNWKILTKHDRWSLQWKYSSKLLNLFKDFVFVARLIENEPKQLETCVGDRVLTRIWLLCCCCCLYKRRKEKLEYFSSKTKNTSIIVFFRSNIFDTYISLINSNVDRLLCVKWTDHFYHNICLFNCTYILSASLHLNNLSHSLSLSSLSLSLSPLLFETISPCL